METFVRTTFFIIIAFALLNAIVSFSIYYASKRDLYLRTGLFWLFLIINFGIQAQSQSGEFAIIMGYGFTMVPLNLLAYASLSFCNAKYPARIFVPLALFSLVLTGMLINTDLPFTVKAMPFAAISALPLLYTVYIYLAKERKAATSLMIIHALVLFALAIHSFNFAFFRMVPEAQLWGWPVAYGLYQLLAVIIPALMLDFSHRKEEERLNTIIDIKTRDLKAANHTLHDLVRQKEYLFRTLTHDISNPLAVIRGRIDIAGQQTFEKESFLKSMSDMTNRITRLIKQVQIFDRIDKTMSELKITDENLLHCFQQAEELFEERMKKKNVRIVYDKKMMANFIVKVDHPSFTNSVLPNVLSNAIKFSHPSAEIRVTAKIDSQGKVLICIHDSGLGIPAAMLEKLSDFESRTSRRGTADESGTGFGIPISFKILGAYGGEMKITSREQSDTTAGFTQVEIRLSGRFNDITQVSA